MKETTYHRNLKDDDLWNSICTSDELLKETFKDIARRLKEERLRQNIDVSTLSKLTGINNSSIYRYEKSTNPVSLQTLIKIAWALNLDIAQVIHLNKKMEQEKRIETPGGKFSSIVQGLSKESVNFMLKTIKSIVYSCQLENVNNK